MALSQGRTSRSGLELLHTCWLGPVGREQVDALCGWLDEPQPDRLPDAITAAVSQGVPT